MSVSDLKYKNKYLKYKNKYLNLQRQIGGVNGVDDLNPPIPPQYSLPDELVSSILMFSKSPPVNKETRQLMEVYTDAEIKTSLKKKLKKMTAEAMIVEIITLDKLFSENDDAIIIKEPLDNREIYLLAKLLVDNIQNKTEIKPLYLGPIILKNLIPALNEPTKTLLLSTNKQQQNQNINSNTIFYYLIDQNDDMRNFQLRFIFSCIKIIKRQGDIILNTHKGFINHEKTFNTIITGLNQKIPLKILNLRSINSEKYISPIFYSINSEKAKVLAEALKTNRTMTTLEIEDDNIGDEGAKAFAEALKTNNILMTLNLAGNKIGVEGAKAFAEALKNNNKLMTLNLGNNTIGDEGATALVNTKLTELYLYNNHISLEGAIALAEALEENKFLRTLNISGNNQMGFSLNVGIKAFAKALTKNTTLTELNLSDNEINDEGGKALAEALKTNKTLTTLIILKNFISNEGAIAFAEALKMNTTLIKIDLGENSIGVEGVKALEDALKINKTLTTLILYDNYQIPFDYFFGRDMGVIIK